MNNSIYLNRNDLKSFFVPENGSLYTARNIHATIKPESPLTVDDYDKYEKADDKFKTVLNFLATTNDEFKNMLGVATIISVLLDCDFRDSKQKLAEWYEENK